MKKNILLLIILFVFIGLENYAQDEINALQWSRNDLRGTARGVGMAGAFGALGGDLTGISSNPAGIGIYRSSEIVTTMSFNRSEIETNTLGLKSEENKFKFNFDNLAYIGYFPLAGSAVKSFNFGVSFNRLKNFDRNYSSAGNNQSTSLANFIAGYTAGTYESYLSFTDGGDPYVKSYAPWLSILGYQAGLINPLNNGKNEYESILRNKSVNNSLSVRERGAIDSYDITGGVNISDKLYLGLTFSFTDLNYTYDSKYMEDLVNGSGGYDLNNYLDTDGSGYQVSVGAIYRPIDMLRLGVAYHSPTWYDMTDYYSGDIDINLLGEDGHYFAPDKDDYAVTSYKFHTPYRWVFSAAAILGTNAIVSVDYEIKDYSGMKFKDDRGHEYYDNDHIERNFRLTSTLKAGVEIRVLPQFSLRGGYAWMQSPLETDFRDGYIEVAKGGTIPHYVLEGDTHYGTFGIGYRVTRGFYMDAAFTYRTQTSDLYNFSNLFSEAGETLIQAVPSRFKDKSFGGLLTLGYKF